MEKPNNGKKTQGRRKIEIKKIEKKSSLQVAFTKRRSGLFRKASELAALCGVEVAILVQSPAEKIYAFGHPSVNAVINRVDPSLPGRIVVPPSDDARIKYEEALRMLEAEKEKETEIGGGFWWEQPYEGMELHQLEEFLKALEDFGDKVEERVEEFQKLKINNNSAQPLIQQFAASSSNVAALDLHDDQDLIFSTYQINQILD